MRFFHALVGVSLGALIIGEAQASTKAEENQSNDWKTSVYSIKTKTQTNPPLEITALSPEDFVNKMASSKSNKSKLVGSHYFKSPLAPLLKQLSDKTQRKLRGQLSKLRSARQNHQESEIDNSVLIQQTKEFEKEYTSKKADLEFFKKYIEDKSKKDFYFLSVEQIEGHRQDINNKIKEDLKNSNLRIEAFSKNKEYKSFLEEEKKKKEELLKKQGILSVAYGIRESGMNTLDVSIGKLKKRINSNSQKLLQHHQSEFNQYLNLSFTALNELGGDSKVISLSNLLNPALVDGLNTLRIIVSGERFSSIVNEYVLPSCPLLTCVTSNNKNMNFSLTGVRFHQAVVDEFLKDRKTKLTSLSTGFYNALLTLHPKTISTVSQDQSLFNTLYSREIESILTEFKDENSERDSLAKDEFKKLLKEPYTYLSLSEEQVGTLEKMFNKIDTKTLTLLSLTSHPEQLLFNSEPELDQIQNSLEKLSKEIEEESDLIKAQSKVVAQAALRLWAVYVQTIFLEQTQIQLNKIPS